MAERKLEVMTADVFLEWATLQDERYELIDGRPQLMAGARARHDRIVVRTLTALSARLGDGPCEPFSGDFAVRVSGLKIRRPDVTVDCGGEDDDRLVATRPVLIVEVLSPSTRQIDLLRKSVEYKTLPSLRHLLFVEPDEMAAILHTRVEGGPWDDVALSGPDAEIPLPGIGITLMLSDFYPSRP